MKRLRAALLATTALAPLTAHPVTANPLDGNIVAGTVAISGEGSATLSINQTTDKAIIDWRTFDIGSGETTTITQPSSQAVTLNRVTGGEGASSILGALKADGQVFIINPDGILIGKDATIDVGALVATTHDLLNADFLAGHYRFDQSGSPNASIVNLGTITVNDGGFAALVAPGVRNAGIIRANLGKISLASADRFTLDFSGDGLIQLAVDSTTSGAVIDLETGKTLQDLVSNDGLLSADGGTVTLTASAARVVVNSVINNTGNIEADTIGTRNGKIVLGAATSDAKPTDAPAQKVKISGKLSASGKQSGETGGTIQITGEQIELAVATIDAFGWNGGGTVLVGGDLGGGNPSGSAVSRSRVALADHVVPTATSLTIDRGTLIDASATDVGIGGKVIVWSDGDTTFSGTIAAVGGFVSGNGGYVETSGRQRLAFDGMVDTSANLGEAGTLLLDPQDISIGGAGEWILDPHAIEYALSTSNVAVVTSPSLAGLGDLTVHANLSWSSGNLLALGAYRNVVVDNGVTIRNTGAGSLILSAGTSYISPTDWGVNGSGTVLLKGASAIDWSSSSGSVTLLYKPPGGYLSPTNFAPHVKISNASQLVPYMWVASATDLQNMATNLNGAYALANIDMVSSSNFIPIGDAGHPFNGSLIGISLDGRGSTIKNLTIDSSAPAVGLFGVIGRSAQIINVHLENANVRSQSALANVGSVAGVNYGLIIGASTNGRVEGKARSSLVGGLVGWNQGSIIYSSADTSVVTHGVIVDTLNPYFGYNGEAGGLVAVNKGFISSSFSKGTVSNVDRTPAIIGGFAGINDADGFISDSYSRANVSSLGCLNTCPVTAPQNIVGGFVGNENAGSIQSAYSVGHITVGGVSYATDGFEGINALGTWLPYTYWNVTTSGLVHVVDARAMTTSGLKSGLPSGLSTLIWGIDRTFNAGYPYLLWERSSGGGLSFVAVKPTGGQKTVFLPPDVGVGGASGPSTGVGFPGVGSAGTLIEQRLHAGLVYVHESSLVRKEMTKFAIKMAALISGSESGKVMTDLYLKIDDAISLNEDIKNGNYLSASSTLLNEIGTAILEYAAVLIGAPAGPVGIAKAVTLADLAADVFSLSATIVVEFGFGVAIGP